MALRAISFLLLLLSCLYCTDQTNKIDDSSQWGFSQFTKLDSINPILLPSNSLQFTDPVTNNIVKWEERNVLNPTAIVRNDSVFLLYRAQDITGTSRIGLATSSDGLKFTKRAEPIFYPEPDSLLQLEWNYQKFNDEPLDTLHGYYFDGTEDPRIVEADDGRYIMTYTAYDGKTARLCLATSYDLLKWTKHGPVLRDSTYAQLWSKSGAIVVERTNEKMVAKKINGKYWMYFGDTDLYMAHSTDLVHWTPMTNEENGQLRAVLTPRPGYFDSRLVEPGPYALFSDSGILLIYNSSNAANMSDPLLPKFTYSASQALFDANTPYKLIDRKNDYFITPDKDYEKLGEVNNVCFVEGLVFFNNKWLLYYGTADSKIAVAFSNNTL